MARGIVPDEAFAQHTAIVGKTGSGKTYTAKGFVERLLAMRRRVCVIDPTGAWWGLRSSRDGKDPGFPVIVFGGGHADVPISEGSGQALAGIVAKDNLPCIIDLSEFLMGQKHRFMEAFCAALHAANKKPLHLIVDEADEFAPQNPLPETRRMLHQVDRLVRRGRIRGFRMMFITQRPAVLHKNILTQANTLIAMRMTGPQDRKAIQEWIKGQADESDGKAVIASLPKLKPGEGWVWAPELDMLEKTKFPAITTFDSSRAPEDGDETDDIVTLADVDVGAIRRQFEDSEATARDNDPKLLRRRIAALEKELTTQRRAAPAPDPAALERARHEGYAEARGAVRDSAAASAGAFKYILSDALNELERSIRDAGAEAAPDKAAPPPFEERNPSMPVAGWMETEADRVLSRTAMGDVQPRHQKILDALVWWRDAGVKEPSKSQVAFIAGQSPRSGAFNNNLGALRSDGLLDYPIPKHVALTSAGAAVARPPAAPPTTLELQTRITQKLQPRHSDIVRALIDVYPDELHKPDLAERIGKSATSGAFNNNLGALRTLGLIEYPSPGHARAADILFLEV